MFFFFLCLDDVPILSDVVVVHSVIHFNTLQFPNGEKVIMTVAGKWSSSLHIEECDFT